jgi:hypothetical protein
MVNENATWRHRPMPQACASPVESAIMLWYWFDADINPGAADENVRNLLKMWLL